MIANESLTAEWIRETAEKNNNADRILVEKVIRAFMLLEWLSLSGLSYIFKGGTALMLLQGLPKRFSIDIDIIVPSRADLEKMFEGFISDRGFTRVEEHNRKTSSLMEKCHYKFYFKPSYTEAVREDNILLDIIVEKSPYENVVNYDIDSPFVKQKGVPLKVMAPDAENLLGDKLTAFAPNTSGIPYIKNGNSAAMEIIKQLYDIGSLFELISDIKKVARTFGRIASVELGYRKIRENELIVLDDIILTAMCISTRGSCGSGDFSALQNGISQMARFIYSEHFHIEQAVVFASRAAYCAMLIKTKAEHFVRFTSPPQISNLIIVQPFETRLNKLKKTNPEAFFYWYQVYLLGKNIRQIAAVIVP